MSFCSNWRPPPAKAALLASIAGELSMPIVSCAESRRCSSRVNSPVPQPRSTTRISGRGCTSSSRSKKGIARSSRNRSYCAGFQSAAGDWVTAFFSPLRSQYTSPLSLQHLQLPCLPHEIPSKALMSLFPNELETGGFVDASRRDQHVVRPERHRVIPHLPGEARAFIDQPPAEA